MMTISKLLYFAWASSVLAGGTKDPFNPKNYASKDVITRDVAVIGGGSTGTYAAINLQSLGKSIVLVEKENVLGGHTNTYTDPSTGTVVDYGVQAFWNISVARDYFKLLDIATGPYQPLPNTRVFANFQTGNKVDTVQSTFNFTAYAAQLEKYPYLLYSWDLPDPVPKDLLLPFGDFIKKYNLQDSAFDIYYSAQGLSNFLNELTIHVLKLVDESFLGASSGASIVPASNNGEIFTKAAKKLGKDVLLSSTVVQTQRGRDSTSLVVTTPGGKKLIQACKLLITIPPLLDIMKPFDIDSTESSLFSKWRYTDYYTMLVSSTGLPPNTQFSNANESQVTYNIPQLPAAYQVTATRVAGLFYVWYGSPVRVTEAQVKADVSATIRRLRSISGNTTNSVELEPQFVEFRSHTPFKLVVSADEIRGGFYDRLEGLQGHRNTWWTGSAFMSHDSSVLWNFTSALLPRMFGT
ncbi:hypothetical protein EKO04_008562 [Ascochyta lentis]|uniref:Beta-cyclopiazonate dehydrogenase n=1 Tax=Ascochyta lentis TaxID=205686 RepID=A0A8H7IZD8_9PLEO|nr:hypothetical protein EKO04_008562 [Ascochyta lentis]